MTEKKIKISVHQPRDTKKFQQCYSEAVLDALKNLIESGKKSK